MIEKGVVLKVQLVEVAGVGWGAPPVQEMTVLSVVLWKGALVLPKWGKK